MEEKHELKYSTVQDIEKFLGVRSVERSEYKDIFYIEFNSEYFRPANFSDLIGEWSISHIDFKNNRVEFIKDQE